MCYERRMKQLLTVFLVLFLFSPLSLAKTQKKIEVCKLTGELIHWQYHYCKALNETDDCEAMSGIVMCRRHHHRVGCYERKKRMRKETILASEAM